MHITVSFNVYHNVYMFVAGTEVILMMSLSSRILKHQLPFLIDDSVVIIKTDSKRTSIDADKRSSTPVAYLGGFRRFRPNPLWGASSTKKY